MTYEKSFFALLSRNKIPDPRFVPPVIPIRGGMIMSLRALEECHWRLVRQCSRLTRAASCPWHTDQTFSLHTNENRYKQKRPVKSESIEAQHSELTLCIASNLLARGVLFCSFRKKKLKLETQLSVRAKLRFLGIVKRLELRVDRQSYFSYSPEFTETAAHRNGPLIAARSLPVRRHNRG